MTNISFLHECKQFVQLKVKTIKYKFVSAKMPNKKTGKPRWSGFVEKLQFIFQYEIKCSRYIVETRPALLILKLRQFGENLENWPILPLPLPHFLSTHTRGSFTCWKLNIAIFSTLNFQNWKSWMLVRNHKTSLAIIRLWHSCWPWSPCRLVPKLR